MAEIEYKEEKKRIFFMGAELVSFCVRYPEIVGKERMNSFFLELAENSISWVTEELYALSREEYEQNARSGEYFTYKPYRYNLQMLADERDSDISVHLSAVLCRGRNEEIKRYDEELLFDSNSEIIRRPKKQKRCGA